MPTDIHYNWNNKLAAASQSENASTLLCTHTQTDGQPENTMPPDPSMGCAGGDVINMHEMRWMFSRRVWRRVRRRLVRRLARTCRRGSRDSRDAGDRRPRPAAVDDASTRCTRELHTCARSSVRHSRPHVKTGTEHPIYAHTNWKLSMIRKKKFKPDSQNKKPETISLEMMSLKTRPITKNG